MKIHETRVTNFQRRFSVNVWCGVFGNRLIGPFVFSHVEYCDIHFVYGFCKDSARAAVEEYQRRFPDRRIPSRGVLLVLTRHCVILAVFPVLLCGLKGR